MKKYKLFVPESYRSMKLYELYPLIDLLKEKYWGIGIYYKLGSDEEGVFKPEFAYLPTTWGATGFVLEYIDLEKLLEHEEVCKVIDSNTRKELLEKYNELELDYEDILSFIRKKLGEQKLSNILYSQPELIDSFSVDHVFAFPLKYLEELYELIETLSDNFSYLKPVEEESFNSLTSNVINYFRNIRNLLNKAPHGDLYFAKIPIIDDEEDLFKKINKCKKPECIVDKIEDNSIDIYEEDYVISFIVFMHDDVSSKITIREFENQLSSSLGRYMNFAKPTYITLGSKRKE